MTGTRYRIVTTQDGEAHVSSVVLSAEEAQDSLHAEAKLHTAAGWVVTRSKDTLTATRGETVRVIYPRAFHPLYDIPEAGAAQPTLPRPGLPPTPGGAMSDNLARALVVLIYGCTAALLTAITVTACRWILGLV
jgi:hypothetical protein